MKSKSYYSNGKLMLTGEYLVIDGAKSLAIPTKKGQLISVSVLGEGNRLNWKSWTNNNKCWLEVDFNLSELSIIQSTNNEKARWLHKLLLEAKGLNPLFLTENKTIQVDTKLDFPRDWGLGSSSTLINNVAQWAQVDPFKLHFKVSNGSGYDIACAIENQPILYTTLNQKQHIERIHLDKTFFDDVFFVHLNKKRNSFDAVTSYNDLKKEVDLDDCILSLNEITNLFINAKSLSEWENAMDKHEYLVSNILQQETIKEKLFPLYPYSIKSLGAWGGDFIMATGNMEDRSYFVERGYEKVIEYNEMIF